MVELPEIDQYQYVELPQSVPYTGPSFPSMQRSDRADLLDKIKPEALVETIRNRLRGKELENGVWVYNPALADRALSEIGSWEIANLMLGTASVNTSISKLQDHEIKRRLLNIVDAAIQMCIANWKRYEINNATQIRFVYEVVFTNALVVLKQADGASIQELLKGTVQENRMVNSEPKKESRVKRWLGL